MSVPRSGSYIDLLHLLCASTAHVKIRKILNLNNIKVPILIGITETYLISVDG